MIISSRESTNEGHLSRSNTQIYETFDKKQFFVQTLVWFI